MTHLRRPPPAEWTGCYRRKQPSWIDEARREAPDYFHLEAVVDDARRGTTRYDAAWLHVSTSQNPADLPRAATEDLKVPARRGTLEVAERPPIRWNLGSRVATRSSTERLRAGFTFHADAFGDLRRRLKVEAETRAARNAMWDVREALTLGGHVDPLLLRFEILADRKQRRSHV